jgi:hypothetical protein
MTDFPHLLRRGVGTGSPEDVRDAEELMDKAADEIERLTQQNKRLREALLDTTVSSVGKRIEIWCGGFDTRDIILEWLTGTALSTSKRGDE